MGNLLLNAHRKSPVALLALHVLLSGCSADHSSYMPLEKDAEWTYQYRFNFPRGVESLKVQEEIALGDVSGFLLTGPMGPNRLAWKHNVLIAEELAGSRFSPPLKLLSPGDTARPLEWSGTIQLRGEKLPGSATVRQSLTSYTVSDRKYPAIKCSMTLRSKDMVVETVSIYAEGLGLVSQEENRNALFFGSLEYLSGP